MNSKKRVTILNRFLKKMPHPTTELIFNSTFELLISVVLSTQSTDVRVNKVTKKLFSIADTPKKMIELGMDGIKKYIKIIGLFNKKSRNIFQICKILIENYNGIVPKNRLELELLPGVGRKVANVVLNVAFKDSTIAVDTHVFRVCNRVNFVFENNVVEMEKKLLKVVPKKFQLNFHNWFVFHGRYVCMAKNPLCNSCFIEDLCEFQNKII